MYIVAKICMLFYVTFYEFMLYIHAQIKKDFLAHTNVSICYAWFGWMWKAQSWVLLNRQIDNREHGCFWKSPAVTRFV